jgi:hypothetical protein
VRWAAAWVVAAAIVVSPSGAAAAAPQSNWAGYVATGPNVAFTSVTATWTQPHVRCRKGQRSLAAIWVGLGGYVGEPELEQIGTDADCRASGKQASYAWFALVPYPAHRVQLLVRPGDRVRAAVTIAPPNVELRLEDRTRHWVFARSIALPAAGGSAEWVVEAPVVCAARVCHEPPLADFGKVTLSDLSAVGNGQTGSLASPFWGATPLELVPGSLVTTDTGAEDDVAFRLDGGSGSTAGAAPGPGAAGGSTFSVSWHP